jgi:hypothetical protein
MGQDPKYGKVTLEHGSIGEDEPVVVFRAKDKLLPALLSIYLELCALAGSPSRHLALIGEAQAIVEAWQAENITKVPDSEASREWMDGDPVHQSDCSTNNEPAYPNGPCDCSTSPMPVEEQ